jgi:hypothetical protein
MCLLNFPDPPFKKAALSLSAADCTGREDGTTDVESPLPPATGTAVVVGAVVVGVAAGCVGDDELKAKYPPTDIITTQKQHIANPIKIFVLFFFIIYTDYIIYFLPYNFSLLTPS